MGPGRGGPGGRGKRDDRGPRDERVDLKKINAEAQKAATNNPFASFFGKKPKDDGGSSQPKPEKPAQKASPPQEAPQQTSTSPAGGEPSNESGSNE